MSYDESVPKAPARPRVIRVDEVNGGHDRAELMFVPDPHGGGGGVTQHRVISQRYLDRVYADGLIRPGMHQAGQQLRDDWERAGIQVAQMGARDMDAPMGGYGGEPMPIADEAAWSRYREALTAVGRMDGNVLRRAAVEDQPVEIHCLRAALGRLAMHYGLTP